MGLVHVIDGRGLDAAVRAIQRQAVLYYASAGARNADLPNPWPGAVTLYPTGPGAYALEGWDETSSRWVPLGSGGGGGGGGTGVTDHGQLTGLLDDDHPQYLTQARGDALFLTQSEGDARYLTDVDASLAYVELAGDTMTGPLTLPGDPTTDSQAATKHYADTQVSLHVIASDPHPTYLQPAEVVAGTNVTVDRTTTPGSVIIAATAGGMDQATADARYVNVTGDTMTGNLALQSAALLRYLASPDSFDVRWDTATRGLVFTRTGDTGDVFALDSVARRATVYGSPVMTKLRHQAAGSTAATTWSAGGWQQIALTVRDDPGALVKANYILLPTVGYYTASAVIAGLDRDVTTQCEVLLRVVGASSVDVADYIWTGRAGARAYGLSGAAFYSATANAQLQFWVFMPAAMVAAANASGVVTVSSLF